MTHANVTPKNHPRAKCTTTRSKSQGNDGSQSQPRNINPPKCQNDTNPLKIQKMFYRGPYIYTPTWVRDGGGMGSRGLRPATHPAAPARRRCRTGPDRGRRSAGAGQRGRLWHPCIRSVMQGCRPRAAAPGASRPSRRRAVTLTRRCCAARRAWRGRAAGGRRGRWSRCPRTAASPGRTPDRRSSCGRRTRPDRVAARSRRPRR